MEGIGKKKEENVEIKKEREENVEIKKKKKIDK
jgi:hypothetical protein